MKKLSSRRAQSELVGAVLLILISLVAMVFLIESYLGNTGFAIQGLSQQARDQELKANQCVKTVYYVKGTQGENFTVVNVGYNVHVQKHGVFTQDNCYPDYSIYVSNTSGYHFLGDQNNLITLYHGQTYNIMIIPNSSAPTVIFLNASSNILEVSS